MKNLLIVESPAKAKTIAKYLGKDYDVIASFGHIRDLPSKNGSVEPDNNFAMHYEISAKSSKYVKDIVDKVKSCQKLILAPDPDREGESIAWHIYEMLKQKKALKPSVEVQRVVFNAITKNSILEAIKNPREIDMDLVNAQQARRALDYLVGFTLSPILWKKLPGSRSAGRVQSVALRMICDREDEIEKFISQEYWDIKVELENDIKNNFLANVFEINGQKLEKFSIINQTQALEIKEMLQNKQYQVADVIKKQTRRKAYPPFITSSMQQEAARKLGFSAKKTMQVAQKLYEGVDVGGNVQGLITYMRTDSIAVTGEALDQVRQYIGTTYSKDYLPVAANIFKSKVKNAQEAHEAIRPTDFSLSPDKIKNYLDNDHLSLYELIFKRMVASQMADAIFDQMTIEIITNPKYANLRATGSVLKFSGFLAIYREDLDDENEDDEAKQKLPELEISQKLNLIEVKPAQHFTEPPPRYSEASLVKRMEELGIGRPSTYASIISVLQDRGYVMLEKKRFFPEQRGRIVTIFLKEFFSQYVEYDYTANLEDDLDIISNGKMEWKNFLKTFWEKFHHNIDEVGQKAFSEVLGVLNEKVSESIFGLSEDGKAKDHCPSCDKGTLSLKLGKFGAFVGCSNYPECKYTKQIFNKDSKGNSDQDNPEFQEKKIFEPKNIGKDPKTGYDILLKVGPYGPYLELAGSEVPPVNSEPEASKEDSSKKSSKSKTAKDKKSSSKAGTKKAKAKIAKPKRVSIPKNFDLDNLDLALATKILSLPREVGIHPQTGNKIMANFGPYGPYLLHDKKFVSVKNDNILEIGLNAAVDLIETANQAKKDAPARKFVRKSSAKKKK
jgi:DNA topoisomerase-1